MKKLSPDVDDFYEAKTIPIYGRLAKIFILFAIICFATSLYFNGGTRILNQEIFASGIVGPIDVKAANTVYKIYIKSDVTMNNWKFITGNVLDSQKNYLFAFGKEVWRASGRDSDGYWSESDLSYDMMVTLKKPGLYYLQFESEGGDPYFNKLHQNVQSNIRILINRKRGSALPHMWTGILALLLAIIFNEMQSKTFGTMLRNGVENYDE